MQACLLHLCRYIHANPVVHGLADQVADWPYSNYLEWIGVRGGMLVDARFVRDPFPAEGQYRAFVAECLSVRRLPDTLATYLRAWES